MDEGVFIYLSTMVFILGLSVGSFLNVCIYRIPEGMSIVSPGSHCPKCGHELKPIELIPVVSFLALRGRCKVCRAPISFRYPGIELLTGIVFFWVFLKNGFSYDTLVLWIFSALLIVVAFVDLDHRRIPNPLIVAGLILGILPIAGILLDFYTVYSGDWFSILESMLIPTLLLFAFSLVSGLISGSRGLGMGDVKLYLVIGTFLGWRLSFLSLWIASVLGGLLGLAWLLFRKGSRHTEFPFGPFIAVGAFVSSIYGSEILQWVFRLRA